LVVVVVVVVAAAVAVAVAAVVVVVRNRSHILDTVDVCVPARIIPSSSASVSSFPVINVHLLGVLPPVKKFVTVNIFEPLHINLYDTTWPCCSSLYSSALSSFTCSN
jgi:hypothetical protein